MLCLPTQEAASTIEGALLPSHNQWLGRGPCTRLLLDRQGHHSMCVLLLMERNISHPTWMLCLTQIPGKLGWGLFAEIHGISCNAGSGTCTDRWRHSQHCCSYDTRLIYLIGLQGVNSFRRSTGYGSLQHLTCKGLMGARGAPRSILVAVRSADSYWFPGQGMFKASTISIERMASYPMTLLRHPILSIGGAPGRSLRHLINRGTGGVPSLAALTPHSSRNGRSACNSVLRSPWCWRDWVQLESGQKAATTPQTQRTGRSIGMAATQYSHRNGNSA